MSVAVLESYTPQLCSFGSWCSVCFLFHFIYSIFSPIIIISVPINFIFLVALFPCFFEFSSVDLEGCHAILEFSGKDLVQLHRWRISPRA